MLYVIENRKGVAMLTGEVGSGKTTVTKALADYMNKEQVQFTMISNPALQPEELLKAILLKLGGTVENGSKTLMLDQLQKILAAGGSTGPEPGARGDSSGEAPGSIVAAGRPVGSFRCDQLAGGGNHRRGGPLPEPAPIAGLRPSRPSP